LSNDAKYDGGRSYKKLKLLSGNVSNNVCVSLPGRNILTVLTYVGLAKLAHYALFVAPRQHSQALMMVRH